MKKLFLALLIITMTGCTQQNVIKGTALRHVISQYENQISQEPDKNKAEQMRKQTQIEVEKVEMVSDTEANVTVKIQSPVEQKHVSVHLVKNKSWSAE